MRINGKIDLNNYSISFSSNKGIEINKKDKTTIGEKQKYAKVANLTRAVGVSPKKIESNQKEDSKEFRR